MAQKEKVVLAYSGGLDTSVAVKWLQTNRDLDVITLTIDMGAQKDLPAAKERALRLGAMEALVFDARQSFVQHFVWPALQAGALYEGVYPLATALSRPLIAKLLVDTARRHGAAAVSHGCTGKGNDQVRMEVGVRTLAPELRIIAPAREWGMTREEEINYAQEQHLNLDVTKQSPYSVDENLWGRSIECGVLEDPWAGPPEDAYLWTASPQDAPAAPEEIEIEFEAGIPVSVDGERMEGPDLIASLNDRAGRHGVGRIDHVENRLVGIKSREIYEAPAATVLHAAHRVLEGLTMTRPALRFKEIVSSHYADMVYDGLWFSAFHQDLAACVQSSQRFVTGSARMRLYRGQCVKAGVRSQFSLYSKSLATYDEGDQFDHRAAEGFVKLHGLPTQIQARVQTSSLAPQVLRTSIMPPEMKAE